MPTYSHSTKTVTLRIVYDGLGTAGKTTNVQQLHELYTLKRQGPVIAPEVEHGRTAYFDWLELTTGSLDGRYDLRCQVLTVPGQFAHAPRRWRLLQEPDAIVCVCDSSPGGIHRARLGLDFLRELRARGVCPDVPIIIQANKRDLPDALSLDEIRTRLALGEGELVVEAIASTGEGVQLTFFYALDAAREHLRRQLEGRTPEDLPVPETPEALLERLRTALASEEDAAYALVDALTNRDGDQRR